MGRIKKFTENFEIVLFAALSALNYTIFVFPNSFAPSGIDGICTMIQDITKVSMGYLSLTVNIPLIIIAFIVLKREFTIKSAVYVISFSFAVVFLRHIDLSMFTYHTDTGTSIVLAPIAAGVIRGMLYSVTLKKGASSGGIDIIAAVVKKHKPYLNFMNILFAINLIIALSSYFVYGFRAEPVICSIIYSFITSSTGNNIKSQKNETIKFEIITSDSETLCKEITQKLNLPATIIDVKGAYSGTDKNMVICVAERKKAPHLESLVNTFDDTVVFKSTISS